MSEICFECFNKSNGNKYSKKDFIISKDLDLCEYCGKLKPVIICFKSAFYSRLFDLILFPFKILIIGIKKLFSIRKKKKHR
jgi:hypothetical protein